MHQPAPRIYVTGETGCWKETENVETEELLLMTHMLYPIGTFPYFTGLSGGVWNIKYDRHMLMLQTVGDELMVLSSL